MHIVSINIGQRRRLEGRSFQGDTGIFKEPVAVPVTVGTLGLEGDVIVDGRHHGGPDQAVYLYRLEDYEWWSAELGRPLAPGTFGENLTVAGLEAPGLPIGTRLQFERVELEVSAPRIPCATLATRMDDPAFAKRFMRAERPGLYCRVLTGGALRPGEPFAALAPDGAPLTTIDLFRACHRKLESRELEGFLAVPIDERTRRDFQRQLDELERLPREA